MNPEEQIDNTITSLKIIGMLQRNGRLCIRKGQLAIETDDRLQALRRWINRDSRDQVLLHLRNTINNAVKFSRAILQDQVQVELKIWTLERLQAEMAASQTGLLNLKTTYVGDPAMVAAIDVLIERLVAHCNELQGRHLVSTVVSAVSAVSAVSDKKPRPTQ